METHSDQDTGAPRTLAKFQRKVQAKAKARNEHLKHVCKKRTPETCLCCGKDRRKSVETQTHTHEIEKDADQPSPEVTVEAVWCVAVRDTVDDEQYHGTDKHDVSSVMSQSSQTSQNIVMKNNSEK